MRPTHCLFPGVQTPKQAPFEHTKGHAAPFIHCPAPSQVCGVRPLHCFMPGAQAPVHVPDEQTLGARGVADPLPGYVAVLWSEAAALLVSGRADSGARAGRAHEGARRPALPLPCGIASARSQAETILRPRSTDSFAAARPRRGTGTPRQLATNRRHRSCAALARHTAWFRVRTSPCTRRHCTRRGMTCRSATCRSHRRSARDSRRTAWRRECMLPRIRRRSTRSRTLRRSASLPSHRRPRDVAAALLRAR